MVEDLEARRLAQLARDEITAHERRCLQMWSGFALVLVGSILLWFVTR